MTDSLNRGIDSRKEIDLWLLHIHTHIHTHKHTYIHTYIHTNKNTYIHAHIHIYKHTHRKKDPSILTAISWIFNSVSWLRMILVWFGLVWFYGTSTIIGYLMPNPFLNISSSSSCRATSTDISDPLSPLLPIIHRLRQVFKHYIPYPHIAAGYMFELVVLLLPGHMWGSIGVHHLWACPCFSSSDLHVWFI